MSKTFLILLICLGSFGLYAQSPLATTPGLEEFEEGLDIGGDIFSDFNEDLEAAQVFEDERFYRYGRFFSVNFGLGLTSFTGNRGKAYDDDHPTFGLSITYFFNFQTAFVMGLEYSKHNFSINNPVNAHSVDILGLVEVSMLRPFFGFRYYVDTTDLGTAITYSNPYFVGRLEYWYQSNKFVDREDTLETQKGGGLGTGFGFGLEFPIELKVSYIGVEALYHIVNYFDKNTQDYRTIPGDTSSVNGYDDLSGNSYSLMVTYNLNW